MKDSSGTERIRIAIIGHESFLENARSYTDAYETAELSFYLSYGEQVRSLAPTLEIERTDCIVCGQTNAQILSSITDIPIVICSATVFDIINAISSVRLRKNRNVALSLTRLNSYGLNIRSLSAITGLNLIPVFHESASDLERKLQDLYYRGVQTLIGSSLSVMTGKKLGFDTIMVYDLKRATAECIQKAIETVHASREQAKKRELLLSSLSMVSEGVVQIGSLGQIEVLNQKARDLFQIPDSVRSDRRYISLLLPELGLEEILRTGKESPPQIQTIRGQRLLISRYPIFRDERTVGAAAVFQRVEDIEHLSSSLRRAPDQTGFSARYRFSDIIHQSEKISSLIEAADAYAKSDLPILIQGETGTGKELFAQSIHNASRRSREPFIAINCASLPADLLESELFGYESGAFTGARSKGKKGLFEMAHLGTLFLDELNSIPVSFQVKLLRVIEEKEIIRIGGNKIIPVDVRIIAATNEAIPDLIESGRFRSDLYFRLSVLNLRIPPLRERIEDLPDLIAALSRNIASTVRPDLPFLQLCISDSLKDYSFPGNVRELRNFLERFFLLLPLRKAETKEDIEDLIRFCIQSSGRSGASAAEPDTSGFSGEAVKKEEILSLLRQFRGNKTKVAKALGCGRNTLYRWMEQLEIRF